MRCEVVAVGTELLLGQIVDTNSSWIGAKLAEAGIDSMFQTKVGDNFDRIASTLRQALDRADAVVVCGGLGPTQDDITRDVIAHVMGVDLVRDADLEAHIRSLFESRGRTMPQNNLRQADLPQGASPIAQMPGTAPGLVCPIGDPDDPAGKVIYAVPGVPYEMKEMVEGTVVPDLLRRSGAVSVIRSRTLRTWGQSESGLAEMLAPYHDELEASGRATLAWLASGIEGLKLRLTAKAPTEAEADAVLAAEASFLEGMLGDLVFSTDDRSMEQVVLDLCRERGLTLATAESVTGGLVASRLTAIPGASDVFRGSVVSYASEVKFDVLGVPRGPVISEEAAVAMAEGACRVLGADVSVAVTGVGGPTEQEGQPVGSVWLATCVDGEGAALPLRLPGDRERVRQFSTISVLNLLRQRLQAGAEPEPPVPVARLFVAVRPPADVLDVVAALPRPDEPGVRWVPPEQWHVTLRFLGEADEGEARAAVDRLPSVLAARGAPVACEAVLGPAVSRLGRSVVCIPVAGLDLLAAAVAEATAGVGEPVDPRPYTGHLTLARLRARGSCGLADTLVAARFAVDEIELVRSTLASTGATHEVVAVVALAGSGREHDRP